METTNQSVKRVFNLIIIDESGSMSVIQHEALAGINETITTCKKMQDVHQETEQRVTLISFDSNHYKIHYNNVEAKEADTLSKKDYVPCGGTPLYDAIGKSVSKMNAQIEADDHVLVTIITDGEENSSKEYNLSMIKTLIEKLKKQNWTFTFIGTDNLDVEGIAGSMSIDNCLSFSENGAETKKMFAKERKCREKFYRLLAEGKSVGMSYFKDEN